MSVGLHATGPLSWIEHRGYAACCGDKDMLEMASLEYLALLRTSFRWAFVGATQASWVRHNQHVISGCVLQDATPFEDGMMKLFIQITWFSEAEWARNKPPPRWGWTNQICTMRGRPKLKRRLLNNSLFKGPHGSHAWQPHVSCLISKWKLSITELEFSALEGVLWVRTT